ncbi:hypothetical protein BU25DRAFT_406072 [Macroventuria anomochaeta]|uniref:Uncharacterized protein n=1 Tax=Macroventuria anomochaeta TaxID=301207 RepID=A0ACB6SFE7_9PLEO|nr:uncharacterized protein BU25DRAFT_406072 [Macroventuria anomochaeta]KAF2632764.1 hypothetical protein BU25DRAFT_406072 [Macroventuria anomochaeta]
MSRFRNRDRSNRPGRGQIEHNVLEGLPINQYREIEVTIGPNAADSKPVDVNAWPELPMPRDSHMLPEHSQQLLRAARSGRTIKPPAPPEDDDNEMKDEETEHKEVPVGFTIKKYVKVARHNEAPELEYLAKRRKGLPSQYINGQVQAPLRETKVKKLDAEGNVAVYKVLAPEGQAVEGEVAPTDAAIEVAPVIAAPGTVVEGVGVVNAEGIVVANDILQQTPPRRRPPPPKKKKQKHIPRAGPGRGRKRVDFVEGAEGQGTPAPVAGGDIPAIRDLKQGEGGSVEPSDRDTPMGEAGEDDESGEDGSEDEEQDQEDGTPATPSKAPIAPTSAPVVEMTDAPEIAAPIESAIVTEASTTIPLENLQPPVEVEQPAPTSIPEPTEPTEPTAVRDRSSSPDFPLSAVNHSRQNSITRLPTSATSVEPIASEPVASEPIPAPVPSTETESVPASVDIPAGEPAEAFVSVPVPEPTKAPSQKQPSIPPSESEPDLLGSLEAELDKEA